MNDIRTVLVSFAMSVDQEDTWNRKYALYYSFNIIFVEPLAIFMSRRSAVSGS